MNANIIPKHPVNATNGDTCGAKFGAPKMKKKQIPQADNSFKKFGRTTKKETM